MINAMNVDRKMYIDKYIIRKMINYNLESTLRTPTSAPARWATLTLAMLKEVIVALSTAGL